MLWKIYFWIYVVCTIIGLFAYINRNLFFSDFTDLGMTILVTIGLFSYVYKKVILSKDIWKVIFIFAAIGLVLEFVYRFTPFKLFAFFLESKVSLDPLSLIIGTIITLPSYYAIWRLSIASK